jgi:hypothetical protein
VKAQTSAWSTSHPMSSLFCAADTDCKWTLNLTCQAAANLSHRLSSMHCCCDTPRPARGKLCATPEECRASKIAASDATCPSRLADAWSTMPGFSAAIDQAMQCREDGGWLAPGVEKFRGMYFGINRSSAFRITREQCRSTRWTYSNHHHHGPPIIGTDVDLLRVTHGNRSLKVSMLRMHMGRPWTLSREKDRTNATQLYGPLYTPCENLAFIMCGLKGYLQHQPGAGMFYLATAGRDIGSTCTPCGNCRPDLQWDACWITKSEYCTLSLACYNGHELWEPRTQPGFWRCRVRRDAILGLQQQLERDSI